MNFDIRGQALLKSLNLRREFHGEDVELGIDLRLLLRGDADDLVHFGPALKSLLYAEGLELRMPYLKPLRFTCEFKNHTLNIDGGAVSFEGVTLSKFEIAAHINGVVELTFNASISLADPECLPALARLLLREACTIDIASLQHDLFSEEAAA